MNHIHANGKTYSIDDLMSASLDLAKQLQEKYNISNSDRVLACLYNSWEHLVLLFAVWRIGATFCSVNPTSSTPLLKGLIESENFKSFFIDKEQAPRVTDANIDGVSNQIPLGVQLSDLYEGVNIYGINNIKSEKKLNLLHEDSKWEDWLKTAPDCIFYTSGSTGNSKGVILKWERILKKGSDVLNSYALSTNETLFPILPVSHVYGLYPTLGAMHLGIDLVIHKESAQPAVIINSCKEHKVNAILCPPLVSKFYFTRGNVDPVITSNLRVLSMGGAATPIDMIDTLREKLPNTGIYVSYGLVETYSTICNYLVTEEKKIPGLVGQLQFGAEGKILRPGTEEEAPYGEIGELCIGACILEGYEGIDRDDPSYFTSNGLYRTGDLAQMDENQNVFLKGRIKELINAGGLSIKPDEIEEVLLQSGAVRDAGVFSHTEHGLEAVYAGVVLKEPANADATIKAVYSHCRKHLTDKMMPRKIVEVEKIPRGGLGKIQRAHLQELVMFRRK